MKSKQLNQYFMQQFLLGIGWKYSIKLRMNIETVLKDLRQFYIHHMEFYK
jgi:hypothetical protein